MAYNILCVDDVDTNLFVLENLFRSKNDYRVILAHSGVEALEKLLQENIDLILLDIMMPEMDGFEVAYMLKQNELTRDIPIIFVTAKTDEKSIKEAFERGGVDYIIKPFKSYELFSRVKTHLKLSKAMKVIEEKQKLLEHILDQQSNLVITTDGFEIKSINRAFRHFFGVSDIDEFGYNLSSLTSYFEEKHYINNEQQELYSDWVEQINDDMDKDFIITMRDRGGESSAFIVKVDKLFEESLYVVSFTDITHTAITTQALKEKAFHDNLTGLYNRDKLNEFLEYEVEVVNRYKTPLSLIMFDIDHFKRVNDTYGHLVGDHILKEIAMLVQSYIRHTDLLARWGGEEFIIASPSTPLQSAKIMAENIRQVIENEEFPEVGNITCSFGVAEFQKGETITNLLDEADKQLYRSKEGGRNRVSATSD